MTWPGWGDVLPALAALLATLGAVIGGMVALARLARPWMREAAGEAADDVRAEVKAEVRALAEKLATNDFPRVEARIERVLQDVGERIGRVEARQREAAAAMEARIGERFDRIEAHLEGIEEDGMAGDEEVEESPKRRQGKPLVGRRGRELADEARGDPGSDPGEFDVLGLAPGQEAEHPAGIGGPGVGVAELGAEELVGREPGAGSGTVQDRGKRAAVAGGHAAEAAVKGS